jgi:hypothetical protein
MSFPSWRAAFGLELRQACASAFVFALANSCGYDEAYNGLVMHYVFPGNVVLRFDFVSK